MIEINGQRYDARTGALLSAGVHKAAGAAKPMKITVQTTQWSHRPPAAYRRTSRTFSPHQPTASRTLMRRAVKKPGFKHRIKAQGHTDALILASLPPLTPKQSVLQVNEKRLQHAKHIPRSRLISRFSSVPTTSVRPAAQAPHPAVHHAPAHATPAKPAVPRHARTKDELLEQALQRANSYQELPARKRRGFRLKRHARAGL